MKPEKSFDCIQMKTEIQERLRREMEELGEEEAAWRRKDRVARDPILGAFLKRARPGTEQTPAA